MRAPDSALQAERLLQKVGAVLALACFIVLAGCSGSGSTGAAAAEHQPIATNQDARLFVEPEDGVEPLITELDSAHRSIDLVVYLLTDREVIAGLESAEHRGVQVRVMLEQHPYGSGPGNEAVYSQLQRAGVNVRWSNPRFKLTHEKTLIVDGREALVLTMNLTASAFSHNREYGAVDSTPGDVAEAEALFNADWNRTGYQPVQADLVVSPENSRSRLTAFVDRAAKELLVESEEIQDSALEGSLVGAARRGVHVRLVISPPESGPDTNAAGVVRLKSGGVDVHYLRKPYIHAKILVADGSAAFVGSENISSQSLDGNRELGVFLSAPDALARLTSTFEQDWNAKD